MEKLIIATPQFQPRSDDKTYNLNTIEHLPAEAARQGAKVIAFHECSITGSTFARKPSKEQMLDLAEPIPDGPSIIRLTSIAKKHNMVVLAGLFEKDNHGQLYKAYVFVDSNGLIAKYRKLHPLINPNLTPGNDNCSFEP